MIITKTNVLSGVTPTVIAGGSSDLPEYITNQDFSYNYTSSSNTDLTFSFGNVGIINYVAFAGIRVKGGGAGTSKVRVFNGTTLIKDVFLKRDHCVVVYFEGQSFSDLIIRLNNPSATEKPVLSYVAAGTAFEVPNSGEGAGYSRAWQERGIKQKTITSGVAAPISTLTTRADLKGRLSLPNMTPDFTENEWQDFLDFGYENIFFISEDPEKPQSSYVCYDLSGATVKAHASTRSLNNVSASFRIFNGL